MSKFRVVFAPALEKLTPEFVQEFSSLTDAKAALDAVANFALHIQEHKLMVDHSNYGVVEKWCHDEWINVGGLEDEGLANEL